ncbi:hypothetical protein MTO96_030608 [Rhipicephalus appendiculatus]
MLWIIIANADAARLRHEQAQQLCKVVGERPRALHIAVLAADAETIASVPPSPGAPCLPVSTAVSSDTSAALESAFPGVPGIAGRSSTSPALAVDCAASAASPSLPCKHAPDPRNVPLPVDSEPDPDDIDTTSTRKRSRPSEPSSDDEGASRKMQAVATERPTVMSPTASSTNVVAEVHSTTKDTDVTNETEFQLVLSKSQKRRQRTSTPQRPVLNIGPPPGTAPAATPAAHSSTARDVHGLANPLSATQAAAAGVCAAADTMLTSASPVLDSCTVLFRPTNAGAQQRGSPAGPKKQGSPKPRLPTKANSQAHVDQENTNLRLLLRAVADLLPPENQLRSICLQTERHVLYPGLVSSFSVHGECTSSASHRVVQCTCDANCHTRALTWLMSLGGAFECCEVTVRLRGVDTTVASVYVRPGQRWNATELLQLTARLGSDFLLCGDMNAHHTMWGSRTCSSRGRDLVDVIHQLGLQVLNTGSYTFICRAGRFSCTAIEVSLASEGARYDWATQPDSWGADHLPIIITPVGGKIRRTRQCNTVDWRVFRQRLRDTPGDQDFLGLVAAAAQAATIQSRVPEKHPAPDLRHLNLRAARRRAEKRYLKLRARSNAHSSTGSMQSAGDMPIVADGRAGRESATLSARQEAVQEHGRFCGPSSSERRCGNPSLQWPSAWASASKNWLNG